MSKFYTGLIVLFCTLLLSCTKEENNEEKVLFAVPKIQSLQDIRNAVKVTSPKNTSSNGKIYVTENLLFYISQEQGIHVFNNLNPLAPQNIAFIELQGVHDIAVKENYLYADNFVDLVVFDLSNINAITHVNTLQNVINFYPKIPQEAVYYDYMVYPNEGEIITGFVLESKPIPENMNMASDALAEAFNSSTSVGVGGSYARFQINNNALYTLENYKLNVFNILNPAEPFFDKDIYMNFWIGTGEFETLFKQKEFLFVGATTGMFVVDASDAFNPQFISGFSHATACDPVVVYGNTAYITVRGGNTCGAIEDQINIIDISDIYNPILLSAYLIDNPYGLGVFNNRLYVCANQSLHVFDATNANLIELKNTYLDEVYDVIPLNTHLIAVGNQKIVQYEYGNNFSLNKISETMF